MNRVGASAPGKALLCGEYAVLDGAPAIVAAVDRRVSVAWSAGAVSMPPEVEATLALAQGELGEVGPALTLDASELRRDDVKLGLGSSAAGAAAAAAAVFASHGRSIDDPATRRRVFELAFAGHASVAPEGSGVDVAASALGGFLRFARRGDEIDTATLSLPESLEIRLIWTGHAARTSDLVAKVRALQSRDPTRYRSRMDGLHGSAARFASAFASGRAHEVVAEAGAYGLAMAALGDEADAPIVDSHLREVASLAARFGGSAKPCGAGGGDVAIAFFDDADAASRFERACADAALQPVKVGWGAVGARAEGRAVS